MPAIAWDGWRCRWPALLCDTQPGSFKTRKQLIIAVSPSIHPRILRLPFRKTRQHIAAFILEQILCNFYLKRTTVDYLLPTGLGWDWAASAQLLLNMAFTDADVKGYRVVKHLSRSFLFQDPLFYQSKDQNLVKNLEKMPFFQNWSGCTSFNTIFNVKCHVVCCCFHNMQIGG